MNISTRTSNARSLFGNHWQLLLWREWRTCGDEDYACHVFEVVANEPINGQAPAISGVVGAFSGALAGGWFTQWGWPGANVLTLILGAVLGALSGGVLAALGTYLTQPSWGAWLQRLLPTHPLIDSTLLKEGYLPAIVLHLLHFRMPAVLSSSLGVGLTGMIFFDQGDPSFLFVPALITALFVIGFRYAGLFWLVRLLLSMLLGLVFGLFFGVGFAQLAGLAIGPFDVVDSARWVGLGVGLGAGFFLGREAGLLSTLTWQGLLSAGAVGWALLGRSDTVRAWSQHTGGDLGQAVSWVFLGGESPILLGWLAGFMLGSLAGSFSRVWGFSAGRLTFAEAYACQAWYLWWLSRPPATEVESTLRCHATGPEWAEALRRLDEPQVTTKSVEVLITYLQNTDWVARFATRHELVNRGGQAISQLASVVTENKSHSFRRIVIWLVYSIGYDTCQRLGPQDHQLICRKCLTHYGPHKGEHSFFIKYYGCRTCGQSRNFMTCPRGVVAVLDNTCVDEQSYKDGLLRVNWLTYRSLFDFDRVEIVQATDEEVERFAVQVGNDTDHFRQPRYSELPCLIAPTCQLSENTLRILQRTFGEVKTHAPHF